MSYIKLDRRLLRWEWKDDPHMVALWVEILLQANYEASKWHGEVFEEGSFPTSIDKLSKSTGLTPRQTRTCLNRLKSTNEVTIESTKLGTKIIVNKWSEYQCQCPDTDKQNDKESDKRPTNERQTRNIRRISEQRSERLAQPVCREFLQLFAVKKLREKDYKINIRQKQ